MKKYICLLLVVMALWGCKSSKITLQITPIPTIVPTQANYLSSRLHLTLPEKLGGQELNGTLKVKSGELIQISLLMPILRTEILRLEVSPQNVLLIDRLNRRYVRASRDELRQLFKQDAEFAQLEKMLFDASKNGGRKTYTGSELGFAPFGDASIKLSEFSNRVLELEPTVISNRYTQISLSELVLMLQKGI